MKKKIILMIFIFVYLTIFILINNYSVKINVKNKNNTYQINNSDINYSYDFLNSYINTVLEDQYEIGFNMLDEDTKKIFNNSLPEYTKNIKYIKTTINHYLKDRTTNNIELIEKIDINGKQVVKYKLFSKLWTYLEVSNLYYSKEYNWFKDLKLIEYLPKKYKISYIEIEKEGTEWKVEK